MNTTTMNTGAASLLPCPMCGAAPKLIVGYSPLNHAFVDCDCGMQTALKDTGEEVTAMWNRRSPTPQADAAPMVAEKFVPDAAMNFAAYLIDHCEGEVVREESVQAWLGKMLASPRYHPAAPSVEQDERGAWFALADGAAASLENAAVCMSDSDAKRSAEGASAFVRKRCRELLGSEQVRLMEWRDGAGLLWDVYAFGKWAKRIVSPIEWDAHTVYLDMVRAGYSEHIDLRLVSASNNANPDEPQSAANVSQGAEADKQAAVDFYAANPSAALFDFRKRIAAPPAQTALTDEARECLMDVVSHHHDFRTACLEIKMASETTVSDELYWQKQIDVLDRMKGQAERALTAAQSASGDTK